MTASSLHASSAADIDLKPLKQVAVLKYLSDPQGRVCQYDMGGECRDKDCENIHLSRLSAVEPSGTSVSAWSHVANLFILLVYIVSSSFSRLPPPTADFCPRLSLDEDTAQFLCSSIPAAQRFGPEVFMKALDVARLANPTMAFEARVQEALSRLGLR